jgi:hypothetical protein
VVNIFLDSLYSNQGIMQLEWKFFIFTFSLIVFVLLNTSSAAEVESALGSKEIIFETPTVSVEENEEDDLKMSAETRALSSYIQTDESRDYLRRAQNLRDRIGLVYLSDF